MAKLLLCNYKIVVVLLYIIFVLISLKRHVKAEVYSLKMKGISKNALELLSHIDNYKSILKHTIFEFHEGSQMTEKSMIETLEIIFSNKSQPDAKRIIKIAKNNLSGLIASAPNSNFHIFHQVLDTEQTLTGSKKPTKVFKSFITIAMRKYKLNGIEMVDFYYGEYTFNYEAIKQSWKEWLVDLEILPILYGFGVSMLRYKGIIDDNQFNNLLYIGVASRTNTQSSDVSVLSPDACIAKDGSINKKTMDILTDILEAGFLNELLRRNYFQLKGNEIVRIP